MAGRPVTWMEIARKTLGLTQTDLGKDPTVRIDPNFISLMEVGRAIPTQAQRERCALRLQLKPEDLLKPALTLNASEPVAQ